MHPGGWLSYWVTVGQTPQGLRGPEVPAGVLALLAGMCRAILIACFFVAFPLESQDRWDIRRGGPVDEWRLHDPIVLEDQVGADPWAVLELPDGRMIVAYAAEPRVQVFGVEGAHSGFWGREGRGPGEFQRTGGLAMSQVDGNLVVWVLDHRLRRVVGFLEDGSHWETRQLNVPGAGHVHPGTLGAIGDTVLVNVESHAPEWVGHWVLAFPASGSPFPVGPADDLVLPTLGGYYRRRSIAVTDHHVLLAHRVRYRIDIVDRSTLHWSGSADGVRDFFPRFNVDRYVREVQEEEEDGFFLRDGPRPFLFDLAACGADVLVALHVRDYERWRAGREALDLNMVFDTELERLDPSFRRVVAAGTLEEAVIGFTNRGRPWTYDVDAMGVPRIRIFPAESAVEC